MAFLSVGPNLPTIEVNLDVTTNPTTGTRTWTDVTQYVRALDYSSSGRSDELQRSSTGTLTCLLSNRADVITNLGIQKRQWIRVRSQWLGVTYAEWQGIIESIPRKWPAMGLDATLEIRAAGIFKVLRLYPLDGTSRPSERGDQRIAAWAGLAGLTMGPVSTDTDVLDSTAAPYSTGSDALSQATAVEESENGLLVETRDGLLSFQGRHWRLVNSASSVGTFGEAAGQIPYRDDVEYHDDDALVATSVSVTALGGVTQVATDSSAAAQRWQSSMTRSLLSSSSALALSAAQYLLAKYKNPAQRIPTISVDLAATAAKGSALVATLLGTNQSSRYTWKRNAPSAISVDVYVEQIHESIRPGTWQMSFDLSPVTDGIGWVLGDATYGLLGVTTALNY